MNCLVSNSKRLKQCWILSYTDLNFFLASYGLIVCQPWCLQRCPTEKKKRKKEGKKEMGNICTSSTKWEWIKVPSAMSSF